MANMQTAGLMMNVDLVVMIVFSLTKKLINFNVVLPIIYLVYFLYTAGIKKMVLDLAL